MHGIVVVGEHFRRCLAGTFALFLSHSRCQTAHTNFHFTSFRCVSLRIRMRGTHAHITPWPTTRRQFPDLDYIHDFLAWVQHLTAHNVIIIYIIIICRYISFGAGAASASMCCAAHWVCTFIVWIRNMRTMKDIGRARWRATPRKLRARHIADGLVWSGKMSME